MTIHSVIIVSVGGLLQACPQLNRQRYTNHMIYSLDFTFWDIFGHISLDSGLIFQSLKSHWKLRRPSICSFW